MKIRLLEALNLIPPLITAAAHSFRDIRNAFAHNLELTTFSELEAKLQSKLRGQRAEAYRGLEQADKPEGEIHEVFRGLAFYCIVCLDSYRINVRILREYLDRPSFVQILQREVQTKNRQWIEAVTASGKVEQF